MTATVLLPVREYLCYNYYMKTYGDNKRISDGLYTEISAYLSENLKPGLMEAPRSDYSFGSSPVPFEHIPNTASSLEYRVNALDESFTQMLMRKIAEEGLTDSECYRMANIDRKRSEMTQDILRRRRRPLLLRSPSGCPLKKPGSFSGRPATPFRIPVSWM